MNCVLHIGLEKTGTTSIQHCLAKNKKQLKARGVLYPSCLGELGHVKLTAYALDDAKICDLRTGLGIKSPSAVPHFRQSVCKQLKREIAESGCPTLLLSNENLSSRLHQESELRRLRELLLSSCDTITVYVYLRRQSELYNASISTAVKASSNDTNVLTLPDFGSAPFQLRYNYFELLKRWENVFGKENIVVRRFDKETLVDGNVVEDFINNLQLDFICETQHYVNKSMQKDKLLFLYNLNKHFPRIGGNTVNPFHRYILDAVENVNDDASCFEISHSKMIDEYFFESNNKIAKSYFNEEILFDESKSTESDKENSADLHVGKCFEMFSDVLHNVLVDSLIENNILKYALNKHCLPQIIRKTEDCCVFYKDSDKLYAHLGHLYLQNKELNKARNAYVEALRIMPDNAAFHLQISVIDTQRKDIASAIEFAQAAVKKEKDNPYAHFHLGTLRILTKEFEGALESLAMALEIEPGNKAFINAYKKAQEYTPAKES